MSSVKFYPISWFESSNWKNIQVFGRLANGNTIYLRTGFKPYFTVKYPDFLSKEEIEEAHSFLENEIPTVEIKQLDESIYRIYTSGLEYYRMSVSFYKKNSPGIILDQTQNIKSKFFSEKNINPGAWQEALGLQTLLYNLTSNKRYSSADIEAYAQQIVSLPDSLPLPKNRIVFFDIESIPSDDISFPDPGNKNPPDLIFSISRVLYDGASTKISIFLLTETELEPKYKLGEYLIDILRFKTEKELLQAFFDDLVSVKPDRLVSFNGRKFDLNYIGTRVLQYELKLPHFSKIYNYAPYFYPLTVKETFPFPSKETIITLSSPGVSQIDLLDFYRRIFPQLGNHKLDTIAKALLGKGKVDLPIKEMFSKYRRGTQKDLLEIIEYSVVDSILLKDLWETSRVELELSKMANFWKNDPEYLLTKSLEVLFEDLLRYLTVKIPTTKFNPGAPPNLLGDSGVYRNLYLYSLSDVYLHLLKQNYVSPISDLVVDYFKGSTYGIVPFKSGYFPVFFEMVNDFLSKTLKINPIWLDYDIIALERNQNIDSGIVDYLLLLIKSGGSWITVNASGFLNKKGMGYIVRPPFRLIQRYVDYLIENLIKHPEISVSELIYPQLDVDLEDFVLETKITAEEYSNPSKKKKILVDQLRELEMPVTNSWRKVRYIETNSGPIIEELYSKNPELYFNSLDTKFYNQKIQYIIQSLV